MSIGIGFYKVEANEAPTMQGYFDYKDSDPMYVQCHGGDDYFGRGTYAGKFQGSGLRLAGAGFLPAGDGLDIAGAGCGYGSGYGGTYGNGKRRKRDEKYEEIFEKQKGYGHLVGANGRPPAWLNTVSEKIPETVEGMRQSKMKVSGEKPIPKRRMTVKELKRPIRNKPRIGRGKDPLPGAKLKSKLMKMPGYFSKAPDSGGGRRRDRRAALKRLLRRL